MRALLASALLVAAMLGAAQPASARDPVAPAAVRADPDRLMSWCVRAVRRTHGAPGPRGGYRVARHRLVPLVNNCISSGGTRV
jgi:hypothetical protein